MHLHLHLEIHHLASDFRCVCPDLDQQRQHQVEAEKHFEERRNAICLVTLSRAW
jgi:hypothetical protein